jgi:hypothetical protein
VSRTALTQFGRALKKLGIHHIAAYSPQAQGRSESVFSTLQDRLPKELKLAGSARWRLPKLAQRDLQDAAQQAVRGRRRAGGFGVRGRHCGGVAGDPVCSGGADGGQRQHGEDGNG